MRASSQLALAVGAWIEERANRDDGVRRHEQCAFQIVTAAVEDEEVDDECRDEERDSLEDVEVEGHVLVHDPAKNDDQGSDENCCSKLAGEDSDQLHNLPI